MARKLKENLVGVVPIEKITNEPFDEIIGHSECERVVFTIENNDVIYRRIRAEVPMDYLPYLGPCVDFGMGDVCIEEAPDCFKFYVVDRMTKNGYEEFQDVRDAIQRLISYYKGFIDTDKLEEIFYQTLGLTKRDGMDMSAGPIKK